jgi:hypothetical protein
MNNNRKTFCNQSLPIDAIACGKVKEGMQIRFPFDGTGVHTVKRVTIFSNRVAILTDQTMRRATLAGTVRLVGVEGYNYHAGHGCPKDV